MDSQIKIIRNYIEDETLGDDEARFGELRQDADGKLVLDIYVRDAAQYN